MRPRRPRGRAEGGRSSQKAVSEWEAIALINLQRAEWETLRVDFVLNFLFKLFKHQGSSVMSAFVDCHTEVVIHLMSTCSIIKATMNPAIVCTTSTNL